MSKQINLEFPFQNRSFEIYEARLIQPTDNPFNYQVEFKDYFSNLPFHYISGLEKFPQILRTDLRALSETEYQRLLQKYNAGIPIKPNLITFDMFRTTATQTNDQGMVKPILENHLKFNTGDKGLVYKSLGNNDGKPEYVPQFIQALTKAIVEQANDFSELQQNIEPLHQYFKQQQ